MATLRITRGCGWVDMLRSYTVLLDGKSAGKLGRGKDIVLETGAGVHTLQARIDWCTSELWTFSIGDTDRLTFTCNADDDVFSAIFDAIFDRSNYLRLEQLA
jgi:hypothetical protein